MDGMGRGGMGRGPPDMGYPSGPYGGYGGPRGPPPVDRDTCYKYLSFYFIFFSLSINLTLFRCGLSGHWARECTKDPEPKACYKCGVEV